MLYALSPKLGLHFEPTVAIAAGLVVLLAGLSLVGSVGDVITGAPVTAAGRFFELVMMTAATIAGVAFVLHLASRFGAPFVAISADAPPALAELPARVAFGAASAAAFALACYAERTAAMAAAFGGAAGTIVFLLAQGAGLGAVVASFVAAVPIGLVGRLMERRNLAPPLVVSITGIVPLLPGLALLHGIYAILNDQHAVGFASVLGALAIGTALAAGVTSGRMGLVEGSDAPTSGSPPRSTGTARRASTLKGRRFNAPSVVRLRHVVRQERGELLAAGSIGLAHRLVDVAFDCADRKGQSLGYVAVGQPSADQHHDLAFPVGQWQRLAGLTKRGSIGTSALSGQCFCSGDASQRRSPQILIAICDRCLRSRVDRRHQVAHPLEIR